jgi:hypothetical protein
VPRHHAEIVVAHGNRGNSATLGSSGDAAPAPVAVPPSGVLVTQPPVPSVLKMQPPTDARAGLENPTPSWNAIHDHTTQERGFGYVSTLLDPYTRFTVLGGASYARFQIPNTPGLTPNFTAFGVSSFNSAPRQCAARSCRAS